MPIQTFFLAKCRARAVAVLLLAGASIGLLPTVAHAESTLDKVISSKTLRCGVMLDYPPLGYRDANHNPVGYEVSYCNDMAAALGAKAEIVETPSAERIPALISNRIDVLIAGTSITPQRALSVAFSQPYNRNNVIVLTRKDTNIHSFNDLKGRAVGGVTTATATMELQKAFKAWNDPKGTFTGYATEAESYLALSQGKIDAIFLGDAAAGALIKSGRFASFVIAGSAPTQPDLCGIAVRKDDTDFLRWVQNFVWWQGVSGRYQQLYNQFFAPGEAPPLSVPGVQF
jgi:ABC-type amino acid transport substrate-binding protein